MKSRRQRVKQKHHDEEVEGIQYPAQKAGCDGELPAFDLLIAADVRSSYKGHAWCAISTIVSRRWGECNALSGGKILSCPVATRIAQ